MKQKLYFLLVLALCLLLSLPACGEKGPRIAEGTVTQAARTAPETTAEITETTAETASGATTAETAPRTAPETSAATVAAMQAAAYSYEIRVTLEKTHTAPGGSVIEFKFSRPFFAGASPLVQAIHRVYEKAEAAYRSEMEGVIADYGAEDYPYEDTRFYEQLCACTYQSGGVFSFVLHMEWFMGGVHNSSATGHTFDFNLGRELKLRDVLRGDDTQITAALENEFAAWYAEEMGEAEKDAVREQSGRDANFYLAEDGVHIFYMPYVVPATQNGVDLLIPWGSKLVKPAYPPG